MTEIKCNEIYNGIYLERDMGGYVVQPCCLYDAGVKEYDKVTNVNDIQGANQELVLTEDTCINCISRERQGLYSKRTNSLWRRPEDGLVSFDLRPGNTCNLKCAMCNPSNSSAWGQDLKLWEKFNNDFPDFTASRSELDWDWIYSKCVDKAENIYIAGGEPFYMKTVQKFLKKLSENPWNCANTHIAIQTNGISNTPVFLEILSKFDKIHFSISMDGWGAVNEVIRFPTNHDELMVGIQELIDVNPNRLDFNMTVQAMNLPNIDTLVEELDGRGLFLEWNDQMEPYTIHLLRSPSHLSINCLKPEVIEDLNIKEKQVQGFVETYEYDPVGNIRMQEYLLELDEARGTNSPMILPWCFV
jgi:molybdenum cofactor biosynthesis enzyme MoaA